MSGAKLSTEHRSTPKVSGRAYRPRDPFASPFHRLVREHFDEFERVYPQRYGMRFGFWRPVIRQAIDKFLECGDLRHGFARVRCPRCDETFFVAFSCKQRGCCPSCDQKRALILGHRLINDVLAPVAHRQWVFTIPKRLRVYFRFTRSLLGYLCRAAYDTVREVMELEAAEDNATPGFIGAVQTFGDLVHWHPHIHAICAEGVFSRHGRFIPVEYVNLERAEKIWRGKVFDLLFEKGLLDLETIGSMMSWKHSGFHVDARVRIESDDHAGMQRLVEYIARCPFSLARMVKLTDDGQVIYHGSHPRCIRFPELGQEMDLRAGMRRNYQYFDPLDFLASVTQHIPPKGEHQIRYYGHYSNKKRGWRRKKAVGSPTPAESLTAWQLKCRITWAALIKCVYEFDPLECPKCGATMRIIGFVERDKDSLIRSLLKRAGLWKDFGPRAPPKAPDILPEVNALCDAEPQSHVLDQEYFNSIC